MTYKLWLLSKLLLTVMITTTCYTCYLLFIVLSTLSDLFPSHSYTPVEDFTIPTGQAVTQRLGEFK